LIHDGNENDTSLTSDSLSLKHDVEHASNIAAHGWRRLKSGMLPDFDSAPNGELNDYFYNKKGRETQGDIPRIHGDCGSGYPMAPHKFRGAAYKRRGLRRRPGDDRG